MGSGSEYSDGDGDEDEEGEERWGMEDVLEEGWRMDWGRGRQ